MREEGDDGDDRWGQAVCGGGAGLSALGRCAGAGPGAEKGRPRGPCAGEGKREWAACGEGREWAAWLGCHLGLGLGLISLFYFLFQSHSNQSNYLNSNLNLNSTLTLKQIN